MTRSDCVFEPEDFIRYLRSTAGGGAHRIRVPPTHAAVFGHGNFEVLRRMCHARKACWDSSYAIGRAGRRSVGVHRLPIGAPAAVIGLEEAVALGARTIVTFGACGSLMADLPIGSLVVPFRAYSDEGTSRHYGGARWSRPDPDLSRALVRACGRRGRPVRQGGVWTTDAPYREGRAKARSLVARGVVAVEMEASAMYAVAQYRRVRIASLFAVSDEIGGDSWNAGFQSPSYRRGAHEGLRVIADVLSERSA